MGAGNDGPQGPAAVIILRGEYDLSNTATIESAVLDALADGVSPVILDLAGVTFFEATGLTALLRARAACTYAGAQLHLRDPPQVVTRLINLTGLLKELGPGGRSILV